VPILVLNRPPAKIFMGDAGSLPIGAVLGYCVCASAWPALAPHLYTWGYGEHMGDLTFSPPIPSHAGIIAALAVLSLMMVFELVPVPMQIASVKLRKKRLFPYTPIHHAFEKAGWREGKVVALFFACQVAFSLLAWAVADRSTEAHVGATKQQAIEHMRDIRSQLDR
jgi:phospho-N-acetylmuramoyl-pentapeptide-transferase